LAQRLALLDPNHAAQFKANAQAFDQLMQQHMPRWQAKTQGVAGVLLYHHDANYLLNRLGVPILGYIEPMAGMPPTAQHIAALVGQYRGQAGQVISMTYQTNGGIGTLAQALHWNASALPADVPTGATAGQYVQLIDQWVAVLSQVR
jgi:zinc/manganese transport system substrate-binding protein